MNRILTATIFALMLAGCTAPQEQGLKKLPTPAQASNLANCTYETTGNAVHMRSQLICH